MAGIGYRSPQEGQEALGGKYTIWLLMKVDRKWHSPKDVSGLPRKLHTPRHVRALEGKYLQIVRLHRARKRR